jgi:tetratricopeptide (TPR) repeat protein
VRIPEDDQSVLDLEAWMGRLQKMSYRPVVILLLFAILGTATAALRPLISQYLQNLGTAYRYKQDLKAAAQTFQRALSVHPFSAESYNQLGQIREDFYAMVGSENWYQLSEWAFKKALALDGWDAFIHRHLGGLYGLKASKLPENQKQLQYDLAEREYRRGIEKSPRKALLYFELGNLLRDAGRMDVAERAWAHAVELEPNYAAALSNLGIAQEMRGDLKNAEANLKLALKIRELTPLAQDKYELELVSLNWAIIHYNLGHILEQQSRWAEAGKEYLEVLALEPDNLVAKKRLKNIQKILQ